MKDMYKLLWETLKETLMKDESKFARDILQIMNAGERDIKTINERKQNEGN